MTSEVFCEAFLGQYAVCHVPHHEDGPDYLPLGVHDRAGGLLYEVAAPRAVVPPVHHRRLLLALQHPEDRALLPEELAGHVPPGARATVYEDISKPWIYFYELLSPILQLVQVWISIQ